MNLTPFSKKTLNEQTLKKYTKTCLKRLKQTFL